VVDLRQCIPNLMNQFRAPLYLPGNKASPHPAFHVKDLVQMGGEPPGQIVNTPVKASPKAAYHRARLSELSVPRLVLLPLSLRTPRAQAPALPLR
jgi:hypothetical protein